MSNDLDNDTTGKKTLRPRAYWLVVIGVAIGN